MTNLKCHIQQWGRAITFALLLISSSLLSAQRFAADGKLLHAYLHNDMSVWKAYVDSMSNIQGPISSHTFTYEYGYCGALMAEDKEAARPYVKQFKEHIESAKSGLPKGHYEMYMSAVYVFELRLHESFHPAKGMSLAKDAVKLAPNDPLVLSYYGTCLFYAPRPFGSKREAQQWFESAEQQFRDAKWYNCWFRPATLMYIAQCYEKQGYTDEAIRAAQELLKIYPDYEYIKYDYLPALILRSE